MESVVSCQDNDGWPCEKTLKFPLLCTKTSFETDEKSQLNRAWRDLFSLGGLLPPQT